MWAIIITMRDYAHKVPILSGRLSAAADMLGYADTIWDVGCDHGFLAAALAEKGRAKLVYATDISPASVGKTARLAKVRGLEGSIVTAEADGLASFAPDGDYKLALCGMGGELISQILAAGEAVAKSAGLIVMQPMRGEEELRRFLCENGYSITDESVVLDSGRYYQLIAAKYGGGCTVPDWFPKGYFRFGWVMCERPKAELLGLLKKYRAVYASQLEGALKSGAAPQRLVDELACVDMIIAHLKDNGVWKE